MTVACFAAVTEVRVEATLTAVETSRRDRLVRQTDRDSYTAAHLLARACAAELLGLAPAQLSLSQSCPRCGAYDHGRPGIDGHDVYISLSHTQGYVAAVASRRPCGIDVETRARSVPARALSQPEHRWICLQPDPLEAFTQLWTRKEALLKAHGHTDPTAATVLGDEGLLSSSQALTFTEWQPQGTPAAVIGCIVAEIPPPDFCR
ncbi:MAG: 4'-phosphopantetheinyl transferase superfamily protein [Nocardioidaceae bacterium]|nr:MAG: 4'-phosphopantetheinyl transferase superfamily protein [Nocardioidaceae bacterium]